MVSHSEENMELKRNLFTYRREGCPIHGVSISESSTFIVLDATKTRYNNLYQICLEKSIYITVNIVLCTNMKKICHHRVDIYIFQTKSRINKNWFL